MLGLLDVDFLCISEICKFLMPMDLCSLRHSSRQLRDLVDVHFRSLYFAREQWLDLTKENIRNVIKILKHFGGLIRSLKVGYEVTGIDILLNAIATNYGDILKGLSLHRVRFYEIDMEKFAEVFEHLEFLELMYFGDDEKYIENILLRPQYLNLKSLTLFAFDAREILQKFFMRKRNIKKLNCWSISADTLPLLALNAADIEELVICPESYRNLTSVAQLRKLKRLEIECLFNDEKSIISLIKELSLNNQLEMLSILRFEFSDEFCYALSNLTNVKELQIRSARFTINHTKSIEILGHKLSKLESLTVVYCCDFPYRDFLASACKSDKFRTICVWAWNGLEINKFIKQMVKDFSDGRSHRCFISRNLLCIYLNGATFNDVKGLLRQDNLQSFEQNANVKILPAKHDSCLELYGLVD